MAIAAGCDLPLAGFIACSAYPHPHWQAPITRPPALLLHGRHDEVVPHSAALALKNDLALSHQACELFSFDHGHAIPVEAQAEMKKALERWLDQPAPHVLLLTRSSTETFPALSEGVLLKRYRVTGLKQGKKHSEVRLSATVGLNIRPILRWHPRARSRRSNACGAAPRRIYSSEQNPEGTDNRSRLMPLA